MVSFTQLVLPILLSAVLVFVASSVIHMVIRWHNPDYRKLPNEDEVTAAIRKGSVPPGQYIFFPHLLDPNACKEPENMKKFEVGPVGMMYVRKSGPMKLGPFLGAWFVYTVVVGCLCAVLAMTTLKAGAPYREVFHLVAIAAWMAYAWSGPAESIWKGKPWSVTMREMVDGVVYACLTAGAFGWLWPAG